MNFIFSIQNHYFKIGTPWIELEKIRSRSWFLSVDIEDDEAVPCYDTVDELRISRGIAFKSVKILTGKTQETYPYWEALIDMSYLDSTELRDVTFKDLPGASGIYMLGMIFEDEDLCFLDDFKKLCEYRHRWDDGVCSKCGVLRADWAEADIKTTTGDETRRETMSYEPCPFCGGQNIQRGSALGVDLMTQDNRPWIGCPDCKAQIRGVGCVKLWNSRARKPLTDKEIEDITSQYIRLCGDHWVYEEAIAGDDIVAFARAIEKAIQKIGASKVDGGDGERKLL